MVALAGQLSGLEHRPQYAKVAGSLVRAHPRPTNECITKWNSTLMSLSPPTSLSKVNNSKKDKRIERKDRGGRWSCLLLADVGWGPTPGHREVPTMRP